MRLLRRSNQKAKTVCFDLNDRAFRSLMNALPIHVGFISTDRKVVFINNPDQGRSDEKVLDVLNVSMDQSIGCQHFSQDNYCGQSNSCRNCQINEVITHCFTSGKEQEREVTLRPKNSLLPQTYRLKASPFAMEHAKYLMLSFENITPIKRKRMMERIFHHDVLNKVNNLQHFVDLAQQEMNKESEMSRMGNVIITGLEKMITGQRALSKAEHDELIANPAFVSIDAIFTELMAYFAYPAYGHRFELILQKELEGEKIHTDKKLLITLLIQMVQNAVEASPLSDKIEIGCKQVLPEHLLFWVQNNQYICEEDKKFIFLPSFSTKGINRGLGTYIIKLFGEGYLQGKVGFSSTKERGTTFFIEIETKMTLPVKKNKKIGN